MFHSLSDSDLCNTKPHAMCSGTANYIASGEHSYSSTIQSHCNTPCIVYTSSIDVESSGRDKKTGKTKGDDSAEGRSKIR